VDLIVSGHTHQRVDTVVNRIPVIQAGSSGRAIAVVDFIRAAGGGRLVRARLETPWADSVTPDRDLANALAREQRAVDSLIGRTVATLKVGMRREGDEYPLGRLLADAFRNIGRMDVGLVNNGGIRADLAAGSLSYGALFDAMPFQNRLVRINLTGAALREVLEHALETGMPTAHVSGLRVSYDPRRPPGQRTSRIRLANGRALDPRRTYTLAVQDFVAGGGDGFAMLTAWPATDAGLTDLDAVLAYLSVLGQPVSAPADKRFLREGR
jgi:5'-nucleotidase